VSGGVRRVVHWAAGSSVQCFGRRGSGGRWSGCRWSGSGERCVGMLVARIRLEVRLAAGIWCQAVPWLCAAGVRREVCRDASEGDLVGGASGCAQLEFGGRCFRMRAAGVRRDACGMVQAGGAAGCGGQAGGRAAGGEVRRAVRRAAGVRREVVGLPAAWVKPEVRQDACGGGQVCSASGYG
jgi:hypothetical protein